MGYTLTPQFCYTLGYILADGTVVDRYIRVYSADEVLIRKVHQRTKEAIEGLPLSMSDVGSLKVKGVHDQWYFDVYGAEFIRTLVYWYADRWYFKPELLREISKVKECGRAFVAGVVDGDGHMICSKARKTYYLDVTMRKATFLMQTKEVARRVGFTVIGPNPRRAKCGLGCGKIYYTIRFRSPEEFAPALLPWLLKDKFREYVSLIVADDQEEWKEIPEEEVRWWEELDIMDAMEPTDPEEMVYPIPYEW